MQPARPVQPLKADLCRAGLCIRRDVSFAFRVTLATLGVKRVDAEPWFVRKHAIHQAGV